jgi:hypothetical protein
MRLAQGAIRSFEEWPAERRAAVAALKFLQPARQLIRTVRQTDQCIEQEDTMFNRRLSNAPLLLGLIVGLVFGALNLVFTWLYPLEDDTPGALPRFYGPMFFVWALASFRATRRTGRLLSGVTTGLTGAFATFCVFDLFILLRVNLFLNELTGRADWQNMMMRFWASDFDSLRLFVNLDYVKGAPLKLGVSCAIGAVMGGIGGFAGRLRRPEQQAFVLGSG